MIERDTLQSEPQTGANLRMDVEEASYSMGYLHPEAAEEVKASVVLTERATMLREVIEIESTEAEAEFQAAIEQLVRERSRVAAINKHYANRAERAAEDATSLAVLKTENDENIASATQRIHGIKQQIGQVDTSIRILDEDISISTKRRNDALVKATGAETQIALLHEQGVRVQESLEEQEFNGDQQALHDHYPYGSRPAYVGDDNLSPEDKRTLADLTGLRDQYYRTYAECESSVRDFTTQKAKTLETRAAWEAKLVEAKASLAAFQAGSAELDLQLRQIEGTLAVIAQEYSTRFVEDNTEEEQQQPVAQKADFRQPVEMTADQEPVASGWRPAGRDEQSAQSMPRKQRWFKRGN